MNASYEIHELKTGYFHFLNYGYVIVDLATRYAAIVDPAWEIRKYTDLLKSLNVEVTAILLTHSHEDHVNLVPPLLNLYQPRIYMSEIEMDYYHYQSPNLTGFKHLDRIRIGNTVIECLVTPGHTAGSTCYLLADSMFSGDTVFTEGCGICNCPGGSPSDMYESIQMIKSYVPDNVKVYPGHSFGKSTGHTLGSLKEDNIYFQIYKKNHFVDFRMRANQKNIFSFK
ncbi:MBL fold metallo-hydrolase [Paenibacillus monticola]|uniref:MBL fold metallo-hydrolase n=1 Tax=Paenibacillus monticola TaxID=2666075 RepID=A0A7X2H1J6_9BACL|nr:MBL fold metallo-hydrolase [Paenibacillus monticola]MRN51851.1 MBL fold metallo-hydrolase [Paenibacillus monticola]